jgi:hypothetical protein
MSDDPSNSDQQPNTNDSQPSTTPQWFTPVEPTLTTAPIEQPVIASAPDPISNFSVDSSSQAGNLTDSQIVEPPVATPVPDVPQTVAAEVPQIPLTVSENTMPIAPVSVTPVSAELSSKKKGSKAALMIGVIVAAILVVLGSGTALAYNYWYENPQKIIVDSIINAVTSKAPATVTGDVTIDNASYRVDVNITGKRTEKVGGVDATLTLTANSTKYEIDGSAIVDINSGDIYFKASNLDSVADLAKMMLSSVDPDGSVIDSIIAKINNTWIKISGGDVAQYSASLSSAKNCVSDTVKKYINDQAAIVEITNLYQKDDFITIDKNLGVKNGSYGFQIKGNVTAANAFINGLKNTKIYTALKTCDSTFSIGNIDKIADASSTSGNSVVELWVDGWTHQISKINATDDNDGTKTSATIIPKFNQAVTVTIPTTFITLTDLKSVIEEAVQSLSTPSTDIDTITNTL